MLNRIFDYPIHYDGSTIRAMLSYIPAIARIVGLLCGLFTMLCGTTFWNYILGAGLVIYIMLDHVVRLNNAEPIPMSEVAGSAIERLPLFENENDSGLTRSTSAPLQSQRPEQHPRISVTGTLPRSGSEPINIPTTASAPRLTGNGPLQLTPGPRRDYLFWSVWDTLARHNQTLPHEDCSAIYFSDEEDSEACGGGRTCLCQYEAMRVFDEEGFERERLEGSMHEVEEA